jgi:hypothetical protein
MGRYTGDVEFYSYGPFKADAIRELAARDGIDLEGSYAYSDSATDLPMLEVVGHPVAVNPDRDLAKIAKERDWEVRTFSHEVPLRSRVPMPTPRRAIGAAVLITLAAGSAGTVWWWMRKKRNQGSGAREITRATKGATSASPTKSLRKFSSPGRPADQPRANGSAKDPWIRRRLAASSPQRRRWRAR